MPRNVEIKAKCGDLAAVRAKAIQLSGGGSLPELLAQRDTFFSVPNGRLKLRVVNEAAELIFYERSDQAGPKLSDFTKTDVVDSEGLKAVLTRALGVVGEVVKSRELVLIEQTRVHLDRVKDLGDFVELEVVLRDEQTVADGESMANDLMGKLGISQSDLIDTAYMDLLLKTPR